MVLDVLLGHGVPIAFAVTHVRPLPGQRARARGPRARRPGRDRRARARGDHAPRRRARRSSTRPTRSPRAGSTCRSGATSRSRRLRRSCAPSAAPEPGRRPSGARLGIPLMRPGGGDAGASSRTPIHGDPQDAQHRDPRAGRAELPRRSPATSSARRQGVRPRAPRLEPRRRPAPRAGRASRPTPPTSSPSSTSPACTASRSRPRARATTPAAIASLEDTILVSTQRMRGVEIDVEAQIARVAGRHAVARGHRGRRRRTGCSRSRAPRPTSASSATRSAAASAGSRASTAWPPTTSRRSSS